MKNVTIPSQFLQELLALCGPEDHELRERVLKSAAPTHPAEGVPAQIETLRSELAEEKEAADNWRRLALQFDNHRMQALGHLKAVTNPYACFDKYKAAKEFLNAPPLDGEAVLAQRIAALAATQPAAQGVEEEAQRNADIGAAVMRACKELPEGVEIQIYLERGAGTVNMTDWDGNEFDHFDEAHNDFACRINAATDGAIAAEKVAAQAKQGAQP